MVVYGLESTLIVHDRSRCWFRLVRSRVEEGCFVLWTWTTIGAVQTLPPLGHYNHIHTQLTLVSDREVSD